MLRPSLPSDTTLVSNLIWLSIMLYKISALVIRAFTSVIPKALLRSDNRVRPDIITGQFDKSSVPPMLRLRMKAFILCVNKIIHRAL